MIINHVNVLKRIGNNLSKLGKLTIYYSFILSNFNYCPLVWHFCGESNTKKLQTIPGGVNFWYVDSAVVSKRARTFLYSY
jgi:hypothetical protein